MNIPESTKDVEIGTGRENEIVKGEEIGRGIEAVVKASVTRMTILRKIEIIKNGTERMADAEVVEVVEILAVGARAGEQAMPKM